MTRHRAKPSFTVEIKRSRTSPLPDGERPQSERPVLTPAVGKPPAGMNKHAAGINKSPAGMNKPAPALPHPAEALFKSPASPSKPSASAPAEPEPRPTSPGRNLWAGTGLLEEAAAATKSGRFDPPDLPIFSKSPADKPSEKDAAPARDAAPAKEAAPAKRVLPSLIAPPAPEPEPEVAPEPEPKLPRVRRYRAAAPPAARRTAGPRPAFVWPEDWPDEAPIQTPAPITVPAPPRSQDRIELARVELPQTEAAPHAADDGEPRAGEIRPRVKRRTGDEDLRIGQRWKRRLPRVCW
ncbi:hypothetical protein ABZT49_02315 [Methylobacterium sp. EM32]|uniref:hypothetical protein n=1 Tax=Methylobacterium sp. EM32 TaxID=3163481 RepID=UPI0033A75226